MSRRERTTALPRARTRERDVAPRRTIFGRHWGEREARLAILGGAGVLLVAVALAFLWRWYDSTFRRPDTVILTVGQEETKLSYFADRLYEFAVANSESNLSLVEAGLLSKLEEESLTILVARDRGVDLSDDAVTLAIAEKLGVPVGGSGSLFDTRYRAELRRLAMGDSSYRRLAMAELADKKLRELIGTDVGDSGELITFRRISVATEEEAQAVFDRVQRGEDMGTIAQTLSLDTETVQQDGVASPEPPALLPEEVRAAIEGKGEGDLIGPLEVNDQWWVFRLEEKVADGQYTEPQKTELISRAFDEAIGAKRASVNIDRNFGADESEWAQEHADTGAAAPTPGTTP